MIRIQQLKLPPDHTEEQLRDAIQKNLRLPKGQPFSYEIMRRSIDARKKPEISYVYTVDVTCLQERKVLKQIHRKNIMEVAHTEYIFPGADNKAPDIPPLTAGSKALHYPPVIVGTGPAGLFCGLMLARAGFQPILLERGEAVEQRQRTVETFWSTGKLDSESNVQFGEGGAGTFSDGKLNTMVKDPRGLIRFVLKSFVQAGADPEILYSSKPHIGTDVLTKVVKNIREEILSLGGSVLFRTKLADFSSCGEGEYLLELDTPEGRTQRKTDVLVLAIGHSSRDTFRMLQKRQLLMQAKSFAVGVRVEHPQRLINRAMYGADCAWELPPAPYKVTHKCENGRGVYSFCMCPGGYVVNASSEPGLLAVNGMSYHDRGGSHANSAIVVTVTPEDYGADSPLAGMEFQRKLEEAAYREGKGKIPVQRFEDFMADVPTKKENVSVPNTKNIGSMVNTENIVNTENAGNTKSTGNIGNPGNAGNAEDLPQTRGACTWANVRQIFPAYISQSIQEGILAFDRQVKGFAAPDTLLSGVESRTSSPVRILRDSGYESTFPGIYPCGEGAGYAGGITSAAMDGIRVAEAIAGKFGIDFPVK